MKILHISDTHGGMPKLYDYGDVIVHSGDMMPNASFGIRPIELAFQQRWVEENVERLRDWIGSRPFLYTPGNHDFIDPTPVMRKAGINAVLVCNGLVDVAGVGFYGFPWVPRFYDWNWMASDSYEIPQLLNPAAKLLEQGAIDVFVSHGPMHRILDSNARGDYCGSRALKAVIGNARHKPKAFLHGHIHESAGLIGWRDGMIVSNAACIQNRMVVT